MNSKTFPILISTLTSILIGYGFFTFYIGSNPQIQMLTCFAAFSFSMLTLVTSFGINYETSRIGLVINYVGTTFFSLGLGLLFLIMFLTETAKWVILPMGLLSLLYLAVIYFVSQSGQ